MGLLDTLYITEEPYCTEFSLWIKFRAKIIMKMSKLRLEIKVAIITGAASGIGEASAALFVANGAIVFIADAQDKLGQQVAHRINTSSHFEGEDRCTYRHYNVTDEKKISTFRS